MARAEERSAVAKEDAVERAFQEIREMIVRGTIAPGTPLIERRVAEVVGASRTTVRNALQQLAHEGFVTVSRIGARYSRFMVSPLTIDEMQEWYDIFGVLDGVAARRAAMLPEAERGAVAEQARELARVHFEAGSGDWPDFERIQELDARFHGSYGEVGGGPLLRRVYASLRSHLERYGIAYATALTGKLPREVYEEHLAIVDAIEGGDAEGAERAAVANWRNAAVRFGAVMRDRGERGTWAVRGREKRAVTAD